MGINVAEFNKDLERFEDAMVDEINEAKRLIASDALELLMQKSPVLTGTYIYNHKVSERESIDPSYFRLPHTPGEELPQERVRKKMAFGAEMVAREQAKLLAGVKIPADPITIGNPVPYAGVVEIRNAPYETTLNHLEMSGDSIVARVREHVI